MSNLTTKLNNRWVSIMYPYDITSVVYDEIIDKDTAIDAEELDTVLYSSQLLIYLVNSYGEESVMNAIMTKDVEAVGLYRPSNVATVLKQVVLMGGRILVADDMFDHVFNGTRTRYEQYVDFDEFKSFKSISKIYRSTPEKDEVEEVVETIVEHPVFDGDIVEEDGIGMSEPSDPGYPINAPKARTCRIPSVDDRTVVVGVVAGRHDMPVSEYIFGDTIRNPNDYSFLQRRVTNFIETRVGLKVVEKGVGLNQFDDTPVSTIEGKKDLIVYITGLTSATAAIIQACALNGVNLTLMHYDTVSGQYKAQKIF